MEFELLKTLLTIGGSFIATFAAVKVELKWIVKTLDHHEQHHDDHYKAIDNLKEAIRYVKR